ncbi:MAG: 50S ribosomal protein L1 [Thermoplasmata archaeon]|nr:50S ribosomal protein L1 [Thermoplasmata archaeon]
MAHEEVVEAVKKAIESAPKRNFVESVDIAVNLRDVDFSIPKNRITEEILLPHGRGKEVKVAVICGEEMALKAKNAADLIIREEELDDLAENKRQGRKIANAYDFFVAEAPLMPTIGKKMGIFLGPRGKMPRPIPPGADPRGIISNLRNTVRVRSKERTTFHVPVGTVSMPPEEIAANIEAVINRIASRLERGKMNIASVYVKTTMGPAVKVM